MPDSIVTTADLAAALRCESARPGLGWLTQAADRLELLRRIVADEVRAERAERGESAESADRRPSRRQFEVRLHEWERRPAPGEFVRMGPVGATWFVCRCERIKFVGPAEAMAVEVQPVDPHDVPMLARVIELPLPERELIPGGETLGALAADYRATS